MALVDRDAVKLHCHAEGTAEDDWFDDTLAEVKADIETLLGVPITAAEVTVKDVAESIRSYGVVTELFMEYPVEDTTPAPVITDVDGDTVDATTYDLDPLTGVVTAKEGYTFPNGPYTIVATIGMSAHPDYATRIESVLNRAIKQSVAAAYDRRNPDLMQESAAGGSSRRYAESGMLPDAVRKRLSSLRYRAISI